MFAPHDNDLYKRLGLNADCSEAAIKAAFFKAVREFPPEKDDTNYKLIREAYDTLINASARSEYDTRAQFGPDIERLERELKDAEEREIVERQITILKKLVTMAPKLAMYRNRLGLAFMEAEQYGEALMQFRRAMELDGKSAAYVLNSGYAERHMGHHQAAEQQFLRVCRMTPDDYEGPRALAALYFFDMERKDDAHRILDQAIDSDGKLDFQDFFCIYDKLFFFCIERDSEALKRELARILHVATAPADRNFAAYMLAKRAFDLASWSAYSLAAEFTTAAVKLAPEDKQIGQLHDALMAEAGVMMGIESMLADSRTHDSTKAMLGGLALIRAESGTDSERAQLKRNIAEILEATSITRPDGDRMREDITRIMHNHVHLYNAYRQLFDNARTKRAPTHERLACPHCRELVRVGIHENMAGSCPHCHRGIVHRYGDLTAFEPAHSNSSGGCFVATAVYGDHDHEHVLVLRRFRDLYLLRHAGGRAFVHEYYRWSPAFARCLQRHVTICTFLRLCMFGPMVHIIRSTMGSVRQAGGR